MSRLTIEVTGEEHQRIKALAALQGKSIKDYVVERIFPSDDGNDLAWMELKNLLLSRIESAETSPHTHKSMLQIAEAKLQALERI